MSEAASGVKVEHIQLTLEKMGLGAGVPAQLKI